MSSSGSGLCASALSVADGDAKIDSAVSLDRCLKRWRLVEAAPDPLALCQQVKEAS